MPHLLASLQTSKISPETKTQNNSLASTNFHSFCWLKLPYAGGVSEPGHNGSMRLPGHDHVRLTVPAASVYEIIDALDKISSSCSLSQEHIKRTVPLWHLACLRSLPYQPVAPPQRMLQDLSPLFSRCLDQYLISPLYPLALGLNWDPQEFWLPSLSACRDSHERKVLCAHATCGAMQMSQEMRV